MKKTLLALVGVLALLGSAVAAPVAAKGPPEKDRAVSAETSATRTRTLVCDETGFTYTIDIVHRVQGARGLGTGTLVALLQVNPAPPESLSEYVFSGTLTFTSDDGSNTLTGVQSGINPGGAVTNLYYLTSGTGRFAQVTGGELTLRTPHSGPPECGQTIVEEVAGFVDGFLTYNGTQD